LAFFIENKIFTLINELFTMLKKAGEDPFKRSIPNHS
jgi:hypothetical protein